MTADHELGKISGRWGHVQPDVGGGRQAVGRATGDAFADPRKMDGIYGAAAERVGVSQDQRLHAVEQARARGQQQILAVVRPGIAPVGKVVTSEYRVSRIVDPVRARENLILVAGVGYAK